MLHLMLESFASFDETVQEEGTSRDTTFILSPGIRGGWDIGDKQVVLGLAVPHHLGERHERRGVRVCVCTSFRLDSETCRDPGSGIERTHCTRPAMQSARGNRRDARQDSVPRSPAYDTRQCDT